MSEKILPLVTYHGALDQLSILKTLTLSLGNYGKKIEISYSNHQNSSSTIPAFL